ncbi:MAG: sugar phosphorylase [Gammaproteobacteria bacterium]
MPEYNDLPHWFAERAASRLSHLYGKHLVASILHRIVDLVLEYRARFPVTEKERWNQEDMILITYGGSIHKEGEMPLKTLRGFLEKHLAGYISSVHILPFFPYSSDDGFSVIDYKSVDRNLGDWDDIKALAENFDLMVDLVINHCSRENLWFIDYINDVPPGKDYFIEMPPGTDLSEVVRPRNSPLLVPVYTHSGVRQVWATFGEDQIDLNFQNPEVLIEFVKILLFYIANGARFIRLDAIAYLWKQPGTRCIHLRQTHETIKLFRDILEATAPCCVLITETNVPNGENIVYFGNSDEAHMVYQFSLPPLLLYALYKGNAEYLTAWAIDYPRPPPHCTYLNFTASHDGIGLRPLEGILPDSEVSGLIEALHGYGGYVTMKTNSDGSETPYEVNITYFDALKGTHNGIDQWQIPRFICAQTVMLSIQGIPAIYIHSLTATPNDYHHVEQTGRTRSINRHIWDQNDLEELLASPGMPNAVVFNELLRRLEIRRKQQAFHPDSDQLTVNFGPRFFVLWRLGEQQKILVVNNITDHRQELALPPYPFAGSSLPWTDLLNDKVYAQDTGTLGIAPYQSLWLEARKESVA